MSSSQVSTNDTTNLGGSSRKDATPSVDEGWKSNRTTTSLWMKSDDDDDDGLLLVGKKQKRSPSQSSHDGPASAGPSTTMTAASTTMAVAAVGPKKKEIKMTTALVEFSEDKSETKKTSQINLDRVLEVSKESYLDYNLFLDENPYKDLEEEAKDNEEITRAALYQNGSNLEFAPMHFRNNKKMVMLACSQYGMALQYASKELQKDKDVVMVACSKIGLALQFAAMELQKDKKIVMLACSQDDTAVKYASPDLIHNDKHLFLAACSYVERLDIDLRHASQELKSDKEVVMKACFQNGRALRFITRTCCPSTRTSIGCEGDTIDMLRSKGSAGVSNGWITAG